MTVKVQKSFADKKAEAASSGSDDASQDGLDAANSAVEGNGDGNVDSDPSSNFRRKKPASKDPEDPDGDHGDDDDGSQNAGTDDDENGDGGTSGADGYGDSSGGAEDDDPGDVAVRKAQTGALAETGDQELVTVIKAEDLLDSIQIFVDEAVQKAVSVLVPAILSKAVGDAIRTELRPLNTNIVTLSKNVDILGNHLDERIDNVESGNDEIVKAFSLHTPKEAEPTGAGVRVPLAKSDAIQTAAPADGPVLNPERKPPAEKAMASLTEICKAADALQNQTGEVIPGYLEVEMARQNGQSVAPAQISRLEAGIAKVQKGLAEDE